MRIENSKDPDVQPRVGMILKWGSDQGGYDQYEIMKIEGDTLVLWEMKNTRPDDTEKYWEEDVLMSKLLDFKPGLKNGSVIIVVD